MRLTLVCAFFSVAAAAPSCVSPVIASSDGCWTWDLSALPTGPFRLTDAYPESYLVTAPCTTVPKDAAIAACPDSQHPPLVPSAAYQQHGSGCINLGSPDELAVSMIDSDGATGVRLTYTGGDHTIGCKTPRSVAFDILCDSNATGEKPEALVTQPGGSCEYTVTWRTPLGCRKAAPAGTSCPYSGPVPTGPQLAYQQAEITALIHFNMATFIRNGDPGCSADNWNKHASYAAGPSSDPATFNPEQLDTDQWASVMQDLGAKQAVLTAKHGCGHLLWPTNVTLPNGDSYDYCVGKEHSAIKRDVLADFSTSMQKHGIGHGFYYSLTNNFYLNVHSHSVQPASMLLPGQVKVSQAEFEAIALAQVKELWTNYGALSEIWFDGGYTSDMKIAITKLLNDSQPNAAAFGGNGVSHSPVAWVGTESGHPGADLWSTGCNSHGDPDSQQWCPQGCDTTLQTGDVWFHMKGQAIRSLNELISVYHDTVGRNGVLEIDFAIDRTGLVDPTHAKRYKELGDWIRACYGTPVAEASGFTLPIPKGATVDRVIIQEDQRVGQRIRVWTVEGQTADGSWTELVSGTSVGNKRIAFFAPTSPTALRLRVTKATAPPVLIRFAAYAPCASSVESPATIVV